MPDEPEPTFVEQLQKAVDSGQVVLITAPKPTPTAPPLRYRDETSLVSALCLIFELKRSQGQMLAHLMAHDSSTKRELCDAASRDGRAITLSTTDVFISALRKQLGAHNIHVSTISTLGYGLTREARGRINELLVAHDAEILSPRPQTGDETPEVA